MPYTPIPDGTVNGPWGSGPYPDWYNQIAASKGYGDGPQKAADFKNYIAQHPEWDFGEFWNQFRPGNPLADHQFYNPANGEPPVDEPDPNAPPPPDPMANQRNHVQTSRPTTPGGPEPGRWQRLVSFRNGVRNERWEWRVDPAPAPTDTPAPTTEPASTETPPIVAPPVSKVGKTGAGGWQAAPIRQPSPVASAFGAGVPVGGQSRQSTAPLGQPNPAQQPQQKVAPAPTSPQAPTQQRVNRPRVGFSTLPQNPNLQGAI